MVFNALCFSHSDLTVFEVTKGSDFTTSVSKQEAELTKDMIESGQWKSKSFKPFNFKAKVIIFFFFVVRKTYPFCVCVCV